MEKSPDAFRTISEVADDLDLPQHVLRFWETRFTQIKPMKRGGGRRYYRPEDVDLLKGIRHLLYDQGYTIKGVQKLIKQNGVKFVIAVANGDAESMEALTAQAAERSERSGAEPRDEGDELVGKPKAPSAARRFLGFGGEGEKGSAAGQGGGALTKDDRALLQETLHDLLECKRLLDQVR